MSEEQIQAEQQIQTGDTAPAETGDAGQGPDISKAVADAVASQMAELKDSLFSMVRKVASDAAKKTKPETKPQSEPVPTTNPEIESLKAEMASLKAERTFGEIMATRPDIDPKTQATLKRLYLAERPDDMGQWLAGLAPAPQPTHSGPAPRTGSRMGEPGTDPTQWTRDDAERDFMRNAPNPGDKYDISNRPYYRKIRQAAEARLRQVRVDLRGDRK